VRLETGETSAEQTVQVRLDPRIQVTRPELLAQQRALLDLHALAKPLYDAVRAATRAEERIRSIRSLLEGPHAGAGAGALRTETASVEAALRRVRQQLADAGSASRLPGAIEGATMAPTSDQLWQIDQAWAAAPGAITALNDFLAGPLAALTAKVYTA